MSKATSRRQFLRKTALTTSGLALLSSTSTLKAFTPTDIPFEGYNPFAEEKTDLRKFPFTNKEIEVIGKIYNENGTNTIANATVEVWHLSPNSKKYRHRAKLKTNANGEYRFVTDYPNRKDGKAPRIFFKVTTQENEYFTELILGTTGAHITGKHWEENKLPEKWLFPATTTFLNRTTINFNITN